MSIDTGIQTLNDPPTAAQDRLQIVRYPHPALRFRSQPIRRIDAHLQAVVRQMFEQMYAAGGVGLAANQVDIPLRIFVINTSADPEQGEERVFINPVISQPKGSAEDQEGCLSLPELFAQVVRPKTVRVEAYDLSGQKIDELLSGFVARVVQHEYDHLEGILFVDRLSTAAQMAVRPDLELFELQFERGRASGEIDSDAQIQARRAWWEQRYC